MPRRPHDLPLVTIGGLADVVHWRAWNYLIEVEPGRVANARLAI